MNPQVLVLQHIFCLVKSHCSHQPCFQLQVAAIVSEKALTNPLYKPQKHKTNQYRVDIVEYSDLSDIDIFLRTAQESEYWTYIQHDSKQMLMLLCFVWMCQQATVIQAGDMVVAVYPLNNSDIFSVLGCQNSAEAALTTRQFRLNGTLVLFPIKTKSS